MTIQNVYGSTPPTSVNVSEDTITLAHIFEVAQAGNVFGARWYEGNYLVPTTGCIAALWDIDGNLLASKTFNTPGSNGWADINFDTPFAVSANTPYIIGVFNNSGHSWSASFGGLVSDVVSGDITFLGYLNDPKGIGQGRFDASGSFAFPTSASGAHSSYGVDLNFEVTGAPTEQLLDGSSSIAFSGSAGLQVIRQVAGSSSVAMTGSAALVAEHHLAGSSNILMSGRGDIRSTGLVVPEGAYIFKIPGESRVPKVPFEKRITNVSK